MIIGIDGPDGNLVPMILRAAMIGTGESAEQQVEDILEMAIKRGGAKLQRLREVFEELYPGVEHDIPDIGDMNIAKFAGGMITSDNCNGALKVKRCMVAAVQDVIKHEYTAKEWDAFTDKEQAAKLLVLEGDCWNHLRNVWFGRVTNSITNSLKVKLKDDLDQIDFRLRVIPDMALVLRASDKEFSLCANYPKGHGDMFREWIVRTHPRVLLFHVVSTDGGRQDMACEGAGAFYMNRPYWAEFLDERLRQPSAANILQECLYIEMTSIDMIGSARIHSILFLSVVMPHRWLAGKSHTLGEYNWSERSMGLTADVLERAMLRVLTGDESHGPGELLLNQNFMFSIWDEIVLLLPPFGDYLTYMYETKLQALAGSSIAEHQFARLRDELFKPKLEDNIKSTAGAVELGVIVATDFLEELRDPKKATSRHLSSAEGKLSWGKTTAEEHAAAMGKLATDDPAESCHGATTREIHTASRVSLGNAGAVGMGRRNGDYARAVATETRKSSKPQGGVVKPQPLGFMHRITPELKTAILMMAQCDAPSEMAQERTDLFNQRQARRRKEELALEVGRHNATEQYVDKLYYHEKWGSAACWKTVAVAERELEKCSSKSAKLDALKEQIKIRTLGLGWADLTTPWSKDGAAFTPTDLMVYLKKIIAEQVRRTIKAVFSKIRI